MKLRDNNIRILQEKVFDVLIIGGGINGAVSAAALSCRGVKTALVERSDFASGVSQESSNLIWGGIKYLESFDLALVYKLCESRNRLLREYPSIVKEIRFLMTHEKSFRHNKFFLYIGTWIYWLFGRMFTLAPRWISLKKMQVVEPTINPHGTDGALEYSDAYLHDNDARFVFTFIRRGLSHGLIAANYLEATKAVVDKSDNDRDKDKDKLYVVDIIDRESKKKFKIRAKVIINSCGPTVDLFNQKNNVKTTHRHLLSKGIHLIVDKISQVNRVMAFFADDGRLFFAIPMGPKTCIGTTDTRVEKYPAKVTKQDRSFVLENINKRLCLEKPLTEEDIISERCGVRPLVGEAGSKSDKDWMQLSRKHALEADYNKKIISIFGGKLTDCLNVGEEICEIISKMGINFPNDGHRWYGEPAANIKEEYLHQAKLMNLDGYTSADSSEPLSERLWRRYGMEAFGLLDDIRQDPSMAELIIEGAEYIRGEIYLAESREMVTRLADFLRRRSKIAMIARRETIEKAKGLKEAARIFFGKDADKKIKEYFRKEDAK